jgi:YD repeat-containing protein
MIRNFRILLLLAPTLIKAQTLPSVVNFKTPEVAAFNKSIETPVSFYTGVPNISIPLYEVNIKGVTVPITLDYQAGGIRADQEATWVGLGFSINYGGQISRIVRGAPDEEYYFFGANNSNASVNHYLQLPGVAQDPYLVDRSDHLAAAKNKTIDYMPDEFHYSILGYSGKFKFSQELNKFVLFPKEDIRIEREWKLTLPQGVRVDFGRDAIVSSPKPSGTGLIKSSWQVKSIRNTANDSITFNYQSFSYSTFRISGQQWTFSSDNTANGGSTSASFIQQNDVRLTSIVFPEGSVVFSTIDRTDVPMAKALTKMQILDKQNQVVKTITFNYSYFYGTAFDILQTIGYSDVVTNAGYRYSRLKLDEVIVEGSNPLDCKKYKFDYYSAPNSELPSKYTFAQDHFGYFNGKNNSGLFSFIPNITPQFFTGGDRRVNPAKSNVFSLKSITYPEGGITEFVYQNNTAQVGGIPLALLSNYQDDNFEEKSASITISSYSRSTSYPLPDEIQADIRYFKKQFSVDANEYPYHGFGWNVLTNFGISALEEGMPYFSNNVKFKLEKINTDGTRTLVKEFNTTSTLYPYSRDGDIQDVLYLPGGGQYEMTVALTYSNPPGSPADNQPFNLFFTLKWRELNLTTKSINVGGLRIKDINYYDSDGIHIKQQHYEYVNPYADASFPNLTSGRVVMLPLYYQNKVQTGNNVLDFVYSSTVSSTSTISLETTSGSYAGYEYVDVNEVNLQDNSKNLRTNYRFSFGSPYFSPYYNYLHMGAWEPAEWLRGKLVSEKIYKGSNVVLQKEYQYYDWSPHLVDLTNEDYVQEINTDLISYQYVKRISSCADCFPADFYDQSTGGCNFFHYGADNYHQNIPPDALGYKGGYCPADVVLPYFKHSTAFDKPKSKTITETDDQGNAFITTENYFYDNTPQHHQQTRYESLNSQGETISQRTLYPSFYSSAPYTTMIQRNMINLPIEQSRYVNDNFIHSQKTNYQEWATGLIAPATVESKVGTSPVRVVGQITKYDEHGNVLEQQIADNVKHSYLWGYNFKYPVAEVIGADHLTVAAIIDQAILTNANGQYTDQQIRDELNKIRTTLGGSLAQVKTYTYKPLVGISSMTDVNNLTTYYEYDSLGRLFVIKDNDGNILKTFSYHYKGQN